MSDLEHATKEQLIRLVKSLQDEIVELKNRLEWLPNSNQVIADLEARVEELELKSHCRGDDD